MEQRLLGSSGLSLSAITFGTMTIGGRDRFSKMGNLGVDETIRMLDICREAGVTAIDTADVYSFGVAEEILGQAIAGRRDDFVLVTKAFMRMGPGPHDTGLSRKHLIAACEASLRRLNTDYLDLYICHEPDMLVPVEETLRAYEDLVRQGKVRYIGCSNHSAWHVMKAIATSERLNVSRYICQQVNYSLVAREVEHEIIPLALDQGCRLMVWSPLHAGLLTGKFRRGGERPEVSRLNELDAPGTIDYDRLYRIVDVLDAIAADRGVTPAQVAINWVLHKPGVDTVIIGARTEAQLKDNLAAATWRMSCGRIRAPRRSERTAGAVPDLAPAQVRHRAEPAAVAADLKNKFGLEGQPLQPDPVPICDDRLSAAAAA